MDEKVKDLWPPAMTSHMKCEMGEGSREKQLFVFLFVPGFCFCKGFPELI